MYDYSKEMVVKLKMMLRNVTLSFPASKAEMITMLEDWDKKNAPRMAAHEPDLPKRKKGVGQRKKVAPPPKPQTTEPSGPEQPLKRKANLTIHLQPPKQLNTNDDAHILSALDDFARHLGRDAEASEEGDKVVDETNSQASLLAQTSHKDDPNTQGEHGGQNAVQEAKYTQKLCFNLRTGKARGILGEKIKSASSSTRALDKTFAGVQKPTKAKGRNNTREMLDEFASQLATDALGPEDGNEEEQAANNKSGAAKDRPVRMVARKTHPSSSQPVPDQTMQNKRVKTRGLIDDTVHAAHAEGAVDTWWTSSDSNTIEDVATESTDDFQAASSDSDSKLASTMSKPAKASKSKKKGAEIKKTEEEIAAEKAEQERRWHESLPLGAYYDPKISRHWRVKNRTVMLKMDNDVAPGKERAPMNQLGALRWEERYMKHEVAAGRQVPLWQGGSSPVGQGWSDDLWDDDEDDVKV